MPRSALALTLALVCSAAAARAATITVGPGCSLGQAILAANSDAAVGACAAGSGTDTIQIGPGVIDFDGPWSLVTESLTALPVITSNLDLVGAGATITVLRRDPTAPEFRFLKIGGFVGVTVRDIGFDGGDVMSVQGAGGAIEIDWNYGGGSTLTLERCAFTNNAAYSGGAIYARLQDALIVRDSTFTGNTGSAGAIGFQESGAFVIQRSTFDGNTSINGTAAFYGGASAVTIEDTDWNDNVGSGGASALFVSATVSLSISGNRFVGNTGGVAVWLGASATGTYEIVDSTFEANVNTANVAGLLAVTANPLAIRGCTFVDNEGFYQGGAAFIGNTSLEHTTRVEDTTFRGNTSLQGGAAYITGGGLTEIDGCTFDHNRATTIPGYGYGRGGALVIGGPTVITSSVFNGNGDEVYQTWIEVSDASAKESGDAGAFTLSTYTNGGAIAADTVAWSVSQSCFVGNGATAVVGPGTSDARNNWWGAASGPGGGGPGAGDTIASDVKHLPFLGAAPAACVGLVRDLDPILVEASFATAAGYATPGADLAAPTMPFVVDPTVGALVIPIVPVNDALVEGPEVARVDLASSLVDPVAYVLYPGPISAELVIEDDGTGCGESCDDAVACTIDVCDSGTLSCTHTPDHAACDDGKACTIDTCTLAGCTHTPSDALCDDDNPCTSDACTVGGTCAHTDVDGDCADADPCTTGTICVDGQCAGGTIIPGCETRKIDLGAPFGEVLLPVPTGDLCFSGSKIVPNCQPLGECQIDVNACFHPNQTWVDVVIAAGLDLWGRVPFRGLWRSGGFCVVADLPDLGAGGPITTTDGTLWACWDGAGKGTLMARATAWSAVAGVTGTSLAGTLEVSVTPDETVRVEGCLTGDVASTDLLAGLPGTLSTSATLTLCLDGGAVVHLREWRPFRDDPSVLVTDVEATFFLDALGRWQLRIDQPLDPIINLCRFILKAGRVIAERVDAERWVVTRRGVASFDFAGQHVETEVTGTVSDEQATLELTSAADLDLFLKIGDPDSDAGGIHVRAPKRLQQSLLLQLDAPELRSLRLACDVATTTVDVYGTTTLPLCDQTITSTVTVHGELGRAGFTMTGSASVSGAWRFPAPLLLPGLPPLPGPLCLGLASEADPTWTVCGAPPADGLWLHTTTTVPLFATSAAVELRVGLAPPETATAYARLAEPLALVAPDDHVPGVTSLTIGAGEVALDVAACGSGESALALQAEATLVTTRGNPVTAALSARATPTRVALELHTKGRWIEPFGLPGLALEQGSDLAFVQSRAEPSHFKLGFDGLAYLLWSGDWPPESPSTPGGEVCNDLPAADEDRDGFVNCLDQDCQNHLFCRSGRGDGQILGLGAALYYDHALRTSAPGPVSLPAISLRFDAGRLIESRVGLDVPSLVGVLEDTAVLDADPTLGFPDERGPAGRLTPLERAIVEGVTAALREGPGDLLFRLSQAGGAGAQQGLVERLRELVREMIDRWIVTSGRLDAVAAQIVRSLALGATSPSGPGLCDVVPLACDDRYLGTSFFRPSAISLSASTRDATFDGNTFSAGMHVIVRDEVSGGTIERHGSFGPTGLTLASYALATQDDGAELLNIPNSDELSYLRIGLGGDPYDRHATFPGDLDHGITIGPAAALAITSQGTVEGTVSRASWTDGVGDAVLASRSGGGKGWGVTLGQSDGTGFARVIMYVFRGGGLNLPTVTRTLSPVVPAGRPTHVAVTWETMTLDGEDVLDVAIYVDGRRQPLDPLYEHPPVPPDVPGAPLRVGAGLGTL
ncbi:MAG: hypothetical protein IT385_30015, partial [Deltaproteobacteria bacterium]|nr:hypothetical protein [Deltaproteobacteria bacterium]